MKVHRDFLFTLCPHTCVASPITSVPHRSGIFVTGDELALTHHHLKAVAHSMCLDKCSHHYYTIQNGFTAL